MNDQTPLDRTLAADEPDSALSPAVDVSPLLPDPMLTLEAVLTPIAAATVVLPAEAYGVGEEIAHGGMGTVLQAEDRRLGRIVAMKVMRLETTASESHRTRFVREATVLARLEHPNIVPIHELGLDAKNRLYYTMKLVQGRTLQGIINGLRRRDAHIAGHYTLDRLLTIFRKVCDAMSLAHAKGVIHRDLKPDNIMVGEFGEVLVMDWGLAKILGDSQQAADEETIRARALSADTAQRFGQLTKSSLMRSAALTLDGDVMGTPLYMSPEQAEGRSATIDQQSDVFSLGGILYALLTLHPPISGETANEILDHIKRGEILPPTVYNAPSMSRDGDPSVGAEPSDPKKFQPLPHCPGHKVPPALSAVTMRALAVDKSKRYLTVAELAADIEAYQGGFATRAEHAGLLTQLRLLVQRHKREFAVAFAAWFVITALAVWFVINLRAKEQRAVAGEQKATESEAVAVREKETARQALAKSQLDLAEKEFERGKFVEAQKIIEETPENFRDANWRFLRAHSLDYTNRLTIEGAANLFRIQFLPDSDRFIVRGFYAPIGIFNLAGKQFGDWVAEKPKFLYGAVGIDSAGAQVAFAPTPNQVAVLDVAKLKLIRVWTTEIPDIRDVLLSPDGQTVLADGNQLVAYAAQTGATLWKQPYKSIVPAISPDGQTVAVVTTRSGPTLKLQLVDIKTGVVGRTIEATADDPTKTALQFNRSGDRLACLGGDEVILWNPKNGARIRALHFPGETVHQMSPGGDAVATVSGHRIRLWDTTSGRLLRSFNGANTPVSSLTFSPDGRMLLSGHPSAYNAYIHIWPTRLGEEIFSTRMSTWDARRILFDRDGERFYTCVKGGASAVTWDIRSGAEKWKFSRGTSTNVDDMAIHPIDGTIILSEFGHPKLTRVSSTGEALDSFGENFRTSLKFSRDGRLLLAVNDAFNQTDSVRRAFSVMQYPSGKILWSSPLDKPGQPFSAFCLDETAVATACGSGGVTVWDWKRGTPLRRISVAQTGSVSCLAASPDGLHLATGGPDRWIRVWEMATGRLEASFRAHWEGVRCVKFSPDGRELLSGSEDGVVRIHDAATGEEKLAFYGHTMPVADVDFSPDGTRIAAITTDGTTKLWDRKRSAEAAALPNRPPATRPAVAKDADSWEILLAQRTPAEVEKTGRGWSRK